MALTVAAEAKWQEPAGLRPIDPARDLGAIADLMALAFGSEIGERGRAALQEMRWMSRLSPLVWWWSQADPAFHDAFSGFVWEEPSPVSSKRQIVGNVSLNRAPGHRRRWIICNVVVKDGYRGRGIGRKLTEAAISEAWNRGAEGILLQVYEDNSPALKLYTDLGFQEMAGQMGLSLESIEPGSVRVPAPAAAGYDLCAWRPEDGSSAYELAGLATPSVLQWLAPVRRGEYCLGWWKRLEQRLGNVVTGRRTYRLVVQRHKRLVAMLTISTAPHKGGNRLGLLIHPDHAGQVEEALIGRGLRLLASAPSMPITAEVDVRYRHALDVLRRYGFEEQRTLLTLHQVQRG
jgi:ribosomal protein S18 acetylase RimI-like enzyme